MNIVRKKIAITVTGCMIAVLGLGAVAEAAEFAFKSEVTIAKARTRRAVIFFGEVRTLEGQGSSDADECLVRRQIRLVRITNHGKVSHGSVYSDDFGSWAGKLRNARRGRYYARATRNVFADEYGDLVVCRAATSRLVRVR